jgi:hypothetical protein
MVPNNHSYRDAVVLLFKSHAYLVIQTLSSHESPLEPDTDITLEGVWMALSLNP